MRKKEEFLTRFVRKPGRRWGSAFWAVYVGKVDLKGETAYRYGGGRGSLLR